jgi:hypothetical protein
MIYLKQDLSMILKLVSNTKIDNKTLLKKVLNDGGHVNLGLH